MKKFSAKWLHRWLGIPLCLLLFFSALSGILLNHRELLVTCNVPNALLPADYRITNWSQAAGKGYLRHQGYDYIYGQAGVWRRPTDSPWSVAQPANEGLPAGIDARKVVAMQSDSEGLWLATQYGLFYRQAQRWESIPIPDREGARLSDLQLQGDSLVLMSRSHIFTAPQSKVPQWQRHELVAPDDYTGELSLFRLLWALHSGEYLGLAGRLLVDAIGIVMMLLSATGLYYTILRSRADQCKGQDKDKRRRLGRLLMTQYRWHNGLGRWLFVPLLFVVLSGWCLRPPLMIPLVMGKLKPWSISHLSSDNPWHERLRALRFDKYTGEWLLSTSEGFYRLSSWGSKPYKWSVQPSVSPMGINVMEQLAAREWLIGSFSGLFLVDEQQRRVWDYLSNKEVDTSIRTRPTSRLMVSGYVSRAGDSIHLFTYDEGLVLMQRGQVPNPRQLLVQPDEVAEMPYSLWQYALELHTGRLYQPLIGKWGVELFVFALGSLGLVVLLSGYIRKRRA